MAETSNTNTTGKRALFSWFAGSSADLPAEFQRELSSRVPGNALILIGAVLSTIATSVAIAWRIPSVAFIIWPAIALLLGLTRAVQVMVLGGVARNRPRLDPLAVKLPLIWAATAGYGAFISVMSGDWIAATLACMSAAAVAGGLCFRYCALPRLAAAIVALSLGPCALAALLSGEPMAMLIGLLMPLYGLTMTTAAFQVNRLLVRGLLTERELERRTRQDPLTGLLNRAGLASELSQRTERNDRFSLLYLDLDDFKNVNDNFGHQIGDELLIAVSDRLRDACAPEDAIARVGGDEFVVLSRASDTATATVVGERLIAAIGTQGPVPGSEAAFGGVSIGIAVCPDHGKDLGTLLGEADAALYQAKYSGRARCVIARTDQKRAPEAQPRRVDLSIAPSRQLHRDAA